LRRAILLFVVLTAVVLLFKWAGFLNIFLVVLGLGLFGYAAPREFENQRPTIFQGSVGNIVRIIAVIFAIFLFGRGVFGAFTHDSNPRIAVIDSTNNEEIGASFYGYECTDDCGGHEAGYEWARDKDIADPALCGGKSDSFVEGCVAYANEH
jgi:hypothetical protein